MNLLPLPQADSAYFLPYQLRWLDDDSPLKIIEKSRQIGLTYVDAYDSVLKASGRKAITATAIASGPKPFASTPSAAAPPSAPRWAEKMTNDQ